LDNDIYVWCNNTCTFDVLGHELIHATFFVMKSRNLNTNEQETFCYI